MAWARRGVLVALIAAPGCGGSPAASPSPVAVPAPAPSPGPPGAAAFTVVLPVAAGDTANDAFGLNPFGIHFGGTGPGGHGLDGHPGWDVEYRIGASVRAAADGIVQSVFTDSFTPGRVTVQIQHQMTGGSYRTVYTNVTSVAAGIAAGSAIVRGQVIGAAGSQSQTIGTRPRTWAMTHFQVDDFSQNEGTTNSHAVNPERFLDASGRDAFDAVWRRAAWDVELTEPFTGNPRDVTFPLRRTWTRESGTQPAARVDFVRSDAASPAHTYVLYDTSNVEMEHGTVVHSPASPASSIDLRSTQGTTRAGLVDIVGDTMRITLSAPGAARPTDLTGATVYRTQ